MSHVSDTVQTEFQEIKSRLDFGLTTNPPDTWAHTFIHVPAPTGTKLLNLSMRHSRIGRYLNVLLCGALLVTAAPAIAQHELIKNGGFELGNFDAWDHENQFGSEGSFVPDTGTETSSAIFFTVGPSSGRFYALADMLGAGAHVLFQSFTVPDPLTGPVILTFDMFVNNWANTLFGIPAVIDPSGLDYTSGGTFDPNQFVTVNLLPDGDDPFDVGPGVILNLFEGDTGPNDFDMFGEPIPHPYDTYQFDVTGSVSPGSTYMLRFGQVENIFYLHTGIDNVSVTAAPEPGTAAYLFLCCVVLIPRCLKRRR